MSEFVAAITFGFIGLVVLAALVYVLGFVISMLATAPYQLVRDAYESAVRRGQRRGHHIAFHHRATGS